MTTSGWIFFILISLLLMGATAICLIVFYYPHFGEKQLKDIGDNILKLSIRKNKWLKLS